MKMMKNLSGFQRVFAMYVVFTLELSHIPLSTTWKWKYFITAKCCKKSVKLMYPKIKQIQTVAKFFMKPQEHFCLCFLLKKKKSHLWDTAISMSECQSQPEVEFTSMSLRKK